MPSYISRPLGDNSDNHHSIVFTTELDDLTEEEVYNIGRKKERNIVEKPPKEEKKEILSKVNFEGL